MSSSKSNKLYEAFKYVFENNKDDIHSLFYTILPSQSFYEDDGIRYFWTTMYTHKMVVTVLKNEGYLELDDNRRYSKLIDNYSDWCGRDGKITKQILSKACYVYISGDISEYVFMEMCDANNIEYINYVDDYDKQHSGTDFAVYSEKWNRHINVQVKKAKDSSDLITIDGHDLPLVKFDVAYNYTKNEADYEILNVCRFKLKCNYRLIDYFMEYSKGVVKYVDMMKRVMRDGSIFSFKGSYSFFTTHSHESNNSYTVSTGSFINKLTYEIKNS